MQKICFAVCISILLATVCASCKKKEAVPEVIPDGVKLNPIFSSEGGVYNDALELTLSLPEGVSGVCIRYTLNGDIPDSASEIYGETIRINGMSDCTVVRAALFSRNGNILGNIVTNTYIKSRKNITTKYRIAIAADNIDLEGPDGIFTNSSMRGREWERVAHIEIFTQNGERIISQDCGLRVFGGSSRGLEQKSLRIIARSDAKINDGRYNGKGSFSYALFDGRKAEGGISKGCLLEKYDRLILRNGGNDSMLSTAADPTAMTLIRDNAANTVAGVLAPFVQVQTSEMVTVYLNGEYYGLLDMKEDINDDYFANIYGVSSKSDIVTVKSKVDTSRCCGEHVSGSECRFDNVWFYYEADEGPQSEADSFYELCRRAAECDPVGRAALYQELSDKIDMNNFLQYAAINLYLCNTDWPHNNIRVWRYTGRYDASAATDEGMNITDGKWRFALRDMDFCFGRYECLELPELYTLSDTDTFVRTLGNYHTDVNKEGLYPDSLYLQGLLHFCLYNDEFRKEFELYCRKLCKPENTELICNVISDCADTVRGEIPAHISRWAGSIDRGYNVVNWERQIEKMLLWARERPQYFIEDMERCLEYYG